MDFGNELVNAYIQRLLAYNNELINKLMLAESKVSLYDVKYKNLFEEHQQLLSAIQEGVESQESQQNQPLPSKKNKPQEKSDF